MAYVEPPSTMKPDEVAYLFVQHGIKKHNDRYESIFMKAVSVFSYYLMDVIGLILFSSWPARCSHSEACFRRSCKEEQQD